MTLGSDAIDEYNKAKRKEEDKYIRESERFTEGAIRSFKETFGDQYDIKIVKKLPGRLDITVDGIQIMIKKGSGYHEFYLVRKCETCGEEFEDRVLNIKDMGESLSGKHNELDCEEARRKLLQRDIPTTEDRLVEVLRDFIHENSRDFGEF